MLRNAVATLSGGLAVALSGIILISCASQGATDPQDSTVEGRGVLQGVIIGVDGLPVEGARVRVAPRFGSFTTEPAEGTVTSAEGRYEIALLTTNLMQPDFRGDVGVATTATTIYFRDTLVYNVRLNLGDPPKTTELDVAVDSCPMACPAAVTHVAGGTPARAD